MPAARGDPRGRSPIRMNIYIKILISVLGGLCLSAFGADEARLDDGLATLRIVDISEETHKVVCLPVGVVVHAPEQDEREPIVMRAGGDVAVNGQVSIVASATEEAELQQRIIRAFGPEYTIDYCKNAAWTLDVKTRDVPLASRAMAEGALGGWTFMAMIPAAMASPAVSLNFSGEIRAPMLRKKSGAARSVRTVTMTGSLSGSTASDSLAISRTETMADSAKQSVYRNYRISSATFPLTGAWEKTIVPEP